MNYLMRYKGKYRLKTEVDKRTNDFVRNNEGLIDDMEVYIDCQHGNKIFTYGHTTSRKTTWLSAYIPSIGRGRNIIRTLEEKNIVYENYLETDTEVCFRFLAKDIEDVATLMKAKTSGAGISPFSVKNLKKRDDVVVPESEIERYKKITEKINKSDILIIHKITTEFLEDIVQKKEKKKDRSFDYKKDIRKCCLARQVKEYIWLLSYWGEFLKYLEKGIETFYQNKNN